MSMLSGIASRLPVSGRDFAIGLYALAVFTGLVVFTGLAMHGGFREHDDVSGLDVCVEEVASDEFDGFHVDASVAKNAITGRDNLVVKCVLCL